MKNENSNSLKKKQRDSFSMLDLSSIFENTKDSVWSVNTAYEILYANNIFVDAFYKSFGIKLKPGTNIISSIPEPIRATWKSRYDRALNKESFSFSEEVITKMGTLYIEVYVNPIVDNGKVIGALFFGKDITQRKLDELSLKNSQLLLKASLESQKDTILFSINKNYEYLYFNSAHENVMKYAYGKQICIGMNVLDCISDEKDRITAKENYDRALSGESHTNIRIFGDENKAYYESFFNPIKNQDNEIIGATGLARDISERKKSELALIEREKELRQLNTTKDKIFSIIGHDLRGPINHILGFSELLIEKVNDPTFTDAKKYSEIIHNAANNNLILLDNLLNWAKSQTKMIGFAPEKLILSDIVLEVIKLYKPAAKAKNISLHYLTADEIQVSADVNMMKTVLRNLIFNAIKFTNPKGEIRINGSQKKNWVEVTVSDNGIGMSQEKLNALFNLSSNTTTIGTANEKGSGLGLLICKEFIENHGGKIWAESTQGNGSCFYFTLPFAK